MDANARSQWQPKWAERRACAAQNNQVRLIGGEKRLSPHTTPQQTTAMDPQRIIQLQKLYQNSQKELWMRGPRSKLLVYPFYAMFTFSTAASLYYTGRAIAGIKDE